ncbi:hypothetical protein B1M_01915 [Burkholderia sp. TJI49]|nr:hypothetical protein B1M_01915 [Burkholderia sp. TJI49]
MTPGTSTTPRKAAKSNRAKAALDATRKKSPREKASRA